MKKGMLSGSASVTVLGSVVGQFIVQVCICLSDCDGLGGVTRLGPKGASAADCRLQSGAALQPAAQRPEDVQELTPELHAHKGVQDGIEAAVQVTDGVGDYLGLLQRCSRFTGVVAAAGVKRVYNERDVVRRPAQKENRHNGHNDPDGLLLLKALQPAFQPVQDAGVAEDQYG